VCAETSPKLLPSDGVSISVCSNICIPPVRCSSFQYSCSIQDLLTIITMCDVQLLVDDLQPVISIQRIHRVRKCGRMMTHELPVLVPGWLRGMGWLLVLLRLQVCHGVGEVLDQLHLSSKELLHCWVRWWLWRLRWWRWRRLILSVSTSVSRNVLSSSGPSVNHLIC